MKKSICFFVLSNREAIASRQFYNIDIHILNSLGYKVTIATKFSEIPWNCDLYYSWWASGSIVPLFIARLKRKPIIVVAGGNECMLYRDSLSNRPKGYLATSWYKKLAVRLTIKFSTKLLIVSEFMREDINKFGGKKAIKVYNAIDTEKFSPSNKIRTEITSIFTLDHDVVELKRGYFLLNSIPMILKEFPEQIFTIIGRFGDAYANLLRLCKELGIERNIRFIDNIPNNQIIEWLCRSKIYIQLSDTETFGMAIAEAMSCQTPVVVSTQGAIPEVVGNCGIFVNHNDHKAIAAGIISLLKKSEEERHELGFKARERIVENFSVERRKKSIYDILKGIKKFSGI